MNRARDVWTGCAVLLVVLIAYLNALRVPFVWDDHRLVEGHALHLDWSAVPGLFVENYWSVPGDASPHSFYRPLTTASFVADGSIWSGRPLGFHLTNLLAHLGVCALAFATARRCGARREWAFLAAVGFGVFPRLTESVTWIAGRTDVLATLFGLAAFFVQIHPRTARHPGRRALAAIYLLLGLLCKEVAIAAFVACALFEWRRVGGVRKGVRPLAQALLPASLACALYLGLRSAASTALVSPVELGPGLRALSAVQAVGEYARMLVTPWQPELFVGSVGRIAPGRVALGVLTLGVLAWGVARLLRRVPKPYVAGLLALGLTPIALVIHVVPVSQTAIAADRFLYMPVLSLALLAASLSPARSSARSRMAVGVACVLCLGFAFSVHARNRVWQDEVTLWTVTRGQGVDVLGQVENEYAAALSRSGRSEEALAAHRRAFDLQRRFVAEHPGARVDAGVELNLALALSEHGFFEEALPLLESAWTLRPHDPVVMIDYGTALSRAGRFRDANEILMRVPPTASDAGLARMLLRQNARAAAIWQQLPPPSPDEPIDVRAQRAYVHHLVGRVKLADEIFVDVVGSPDATPEILERAEQVLAQQMRVIPDSPYPRALADALEERTRSVALGRGTPGGAGVTPAVP
jgi:Flp pilus assembly protein TadD